MACWGCHVKLGFFKTRFSNSELLRFWRGKKSWGGSCLNEDFPPLQSEARGQELQGSGEGGLGLQEHRGTLRMRPPWPPETAPVGEERKIPQRRRVGSFLQDPPLGRPV